MSSISDKCYFKIFKNLLLVWDTGEKIYLYTWAFFTLNYRTFFTFERFTSAKDMTQNDHFLMLFSGKTHNNFYTAAEFLKDFQSSQEAPLSVTSAEWEGMAPCRGMQHFLSYQGILSEIIVSHILKILKGRQRAHYWFRMRTCCKASIRTLQFWQFTAISSSVAHYFLHKATLKPLICF